MTKTATAEMLENYSKLHKQAVDKVLAILDAPDWEKTKEDTDIVFYKRFVKDSPLAQIKSVVYIPDTTMDEVKEVLQPVPKVDKDTPENQRHKMDYAYELEGSGNGYQLYVIGTQAPGMMVSGREFILFRKLVEKGGYYTAINVSVPDNDLVPVDKHHVRGEMFFQGFAARVSPKNEKDIELNFVVHSDPKGSLPVALFNKVVTFQGFAARGVRNQIMEKHQKK